MNKKFDFIKICTCTCKDSDIKIFKLHICIYAYTVDRVESPKTDTPLSGQHSTTDKSPGTE